MAKVLLSLLPLLAVYSCVTQNPPEEEKEEVEHSYDEIKNQRVSWSQIFNQKESNYLLYFYSETCSHCMELKNDIIEFSYRSTLPFFFVKQSPDFVFNENIEETIGATTLDVFFIKGTPSFVEIKSKKVNKNIAGVSKIRDYISYN